MPHDDPFSRYEADDPFAKYETGVGALARGVGKALAVDVPLGVLHLATTPIRAAIGGRQTVAQARREVSGARSARAPSFVDPNAAVHVAIRRAAEGDETPIEAAGSTARSLVTVGYDAMRALQEAEGTEAKARAATGLGVLLSPLLSGKVRSGLAKPFRSAPRTPATPLPSHVAPKPTTLREALAGQLEEPHAVDLEAAPRLEPHARISNEAPVVAAGQATRIRPQTAELGTTIVRSGEIDAFTKYDNIAEGGSLIEPHRVDLPESRLVPAMKLRDGRTISDPQAVHHADVLERHGIPENQWEQVVEASGFLDEAGNFVQPRTSRVPTWMRRAKPDEPPPAPVPAAPAGPVAPKPRRVQPLPKEKPAEPEGGLAPNNPLSQLDDHIAALTEEERAHQVAPDKLRELSDAELEARPLGRSPRPGERNVDLPSEPEMDVAQATRSILERERRKGPIRPDDLRAYVEPAAPYEQQPKATPELAEGERRAPPPAEPYDMAAGMAEVEGFRNHSQANPFLPDDPSGRKFHAAFEEGRRRAQAGEPMSESAKHASYDMGVMGDYVEATAPELQTGPAIERPAPPGWKPRRIQPLPNVAPAKLSAGSFGKSESGSTSFTFEVLDDSGKKIGHVAGEIDRSGITTYSGAVESGAFSPELAARVEAALRAEAGRDLNFYRASEPRQGGALTTFGTDKIDFTAGSIAARQRVRGESTAPGASVPQPPRKLRPEPVLIKTNIKVPSETHGNARVTGVRYHIADETGKLVGDAVRNLRDAKSAALRSTGYLYDATDGRVYKVGREAQPRKPIVPNIPPKPPEGLGGEGGFLRLSSTPAPVSPARARVRATYDVGGKMRVREPWSAWLGSAKNWFVQKAAKTTKAFWVAEERVPDGIELKAIESPGLWADAALDSPKRIRAAIEGIGPGRWDPNGNFVLTGTPSLKRILEPFAGNEEALGPLRDYLKAKHAYEVEQQGKQSGVQIADALDVIRDTPPDIVKAAEQITALLNDALDYVIDAGGFDAQLALELRAMYKSYIPFWRVFEEGSASRGTGSPLHPASPIKEMTGSERATLDPLEASSEYVSRLIRFGDIIRPTRALADLAERFPDELQGVIERIDAPPTTPQQFFADALSDRGLALRENTVRVWRPGPKVWRNGKLVAGPGIAESWRVSPFVADALKGMGHIDFGLITSLLGAFSGSLRTGVTANPGFGAANFFRDNFVRALQSEATNLPFQGTARAFGDVVARSPEFQRYQAMGGGMGLIESGAGSLNQLASKLPGRMGEAAQQRARNVDVGRLTRKPRPVVRTFFHPIEALRELSKPFEEISRFAEFEALKKAGKSDLEAYHGSQEALVNFAQHGSSPAIRAIAHTTAFLNPALQSFRAMGSSALAQPGKFLTAGLIGITLPTYLLWLANKDDEEIQQLRRAPGGIGYWLFRIPGGEIGKLPKPFLYGQLFGTSLESALDESDPLAWQRFAHGVKQQLAFNALPTLGYVGYGLGANKDPYFDVPLVPADAERVEPAYQANRYTTELARKIGIKFNISPAKFEFALRGLTGTLGRDVFQLADRFLSPPGDAAKPEPVLSDLPDLGRFFARYPSATVAPIRDLYDAARGPIEKNATYEFLLRHNRAQEAAAYVEANKEDLALAPVYQGATELLSQFRSAVDAIEAVPGMSPQEKRETINDLLRQMIEQADILNVALRDARASLASPADAK